MISPCSPAGVEDLVTFFSTSHEGRTSQAMVDSLLLMHLNLNPFFDMTLSQWPLDLWHDKARLAPHSCLTA